MLVLAVVAGGVFCAWKMAVDEGHSAENEGPLMESHNRLLRSEIPSIAANSIKYRELFADNNDVQLRAAKRMGLKNPDAVKQPEECDELVEVKTNEWYTVDTLYHSKPYLVPEATLLLRYISRRFGELQKEEGMEKRVRPIVTSMLRNKSQVGRLRRVNRNATENSCHLYGTTFDLSYCRFVTTDGEEVMDNGRYKQLLALALYELRFEGLCYVKYERRPPCFHITVRAVDYDGELECAMEEYEVGWPERSCTEQLAVSTEEKQKIEKTLGMTEKPVAEKKNEQMKDTEKAEKTEKSEKAAPAVKNDNTTTNKPKEHRHYKEFEHRSNYVFD